MIEISGGLPASMVIEQIRRDLFKIEHADDLLKEQVELTF